MSRFSGIWSNTGRDATMTYDEKRIVSRTVYAWDPVSREHFEPYVVVMKPTKAVYRNWVYTPDSIARKFGNIPVVHVDEGSRANHNKVCLWCGETSHKDTSGHPTPYLQHEILCGSRSVLEDAWFCSANCCYRAKHGNQSGMSSREKERLGINEE